MPTPSSRLPRLPRGRQTVPRDLVAAHQRERILEATVRLIGAQGYNETTLEQITKQARIAWATLYQNFESKEDCYLAAFDQAVDDAAAQLAEAVADRSAWADRVDTGIETLVELIVADPARAAMCLVEFQSAGPQARARYEAVVQRLAAVLHEGREGRDSAGRPEKLEESIVGGIAWLIQGALAERKPERVRSLLPEMLQIALTPYLAEDEANRHALAARSSRG